jgi:hypothetical protein
MIGFGIPPIPINGSTDVNSELQMESSVGKERKKEKRFSQ